MIVIRVEVGSKEKKMVDVGVGSERVIRAELELGSTAVLVAMLERVEEELVRTELELEREVVCWMHDRLARLVSAWTAVGSVRKERTATRATLQRVDGMVLDG